MEVLVVIVIICILAALVIPAISKAQRNARVIGCLSNLKHLWTMQNNYMVVFGGERQLYPTETGGDFWLKMKNTDPPLIDSTVLDIFVCGLTGTIAGGVTTDYRGPASNVNNFGDGDPVGADKIGNHGPDSGGNLLRKSGDVVTLGPTSSQFLSPKITP